ncbi:MAG: hypothetical protein BMS9Abin21_012 [Thermodesulfovibrionia bacterium]|nr:MAG: hypothetical protein BMS9Abin21_012 [Thermodesulfovibrionia bacterium]
MEVIVIGGKTSLAFNLFQTHKKYLPLFGIVLQLNVLFFDKDSKLFAGTKNYQAERN